MPHTSPSCSGKRRHTAEAWRLGLLRRCGCSRWRSQRPSSRGSPPYSSTSPASPPHVMPRPHLSRPSVCVSCGRSLTPDWWVRADGGARLSEADLASLAALRGSFSKCVVRSCSSNSSHDQLITCLSAPAHLVPHCGCDLWGSLTRRSHQLWWTGRVIASKFLIPCANCSESEVHCSVCTR